MEESKMKRSVKDSVFTYLFRQPEYARQLYLKFHPEDTEVTEEDIKLVTLENILTTGLYNDLGYQVRNTVILLFEAQSTFTINMALRVLLYLAATYKEHVEEMELNLYSAKAVQIPRPELYVIYTGSQPDVPEEIRLSDLYEGKGDAELRVKVLRGDGTRDILDQYVRFCEVADENREKYGRNRKAVEETIRQCMAEGVLAPFLASRQKEVHDIMVTLFDEQKIREIHEHSIAKDAKEEGLQEGRQEGRKEGRQEGRKEERENSIREMILVMRKFSADRKSVIQQLADSYGLNAQAAEEKVDLYWN